MLCSDTDTISKVLRVNKIATKNVKFKGVACDTRSHMEGALFLALVGDNFDAHDYIAQAEKMGAVAIIVNRVIASNLVTIVVDDTKKALAIIARWHLNSIKPKVIAITGSNGKTTTKNMLASILSLKAPTLATSGNFNNHLGVPMTLLNLSKTHAYVVVEMGANHVGEIAYLCSIAKPDISVITNANDAHLGAFGSIKNLVNTKGEIYQALNVDGIAVINKDSEFALKWKSIIGKHKNIQFGNNSTIFATNIRLKNKQTVFNLHIGKAQKQVILPMIGLHNVDNALVAAACACALKISITKIKQGLENTNAEKGRLNVISSNKLTIIDDSYNANPSSIKVAIKTLMHFSGDKVLVLGEMAELGYKSIKLHQQIGLIAKKSIANVYTYGNKAQSYGGINFKSMEALAKYIIKKHSVATVLVKGSRIVKLENLVKLLQVN